MAKPKVFIYQPVDETGESHKRMEAAGIEVKLAEKPVPGTPHRRTELMFEPGTVATAGVGVTNFGRIISRASLESASDLRLVAKYTVGYDNVDIEAANELGILVVHSPTESNWGGVAEGTVTCLLAMLKRVRERDRLVKQGEWRRDESLMGTYLGARQMDHYQGITIGIIGLGRIGSRVADLLAPWRVRLIACDPYVDESKFVHHNAEPVDLETLLKESDVVTLHCNLTKETTNIISRDQLGLMKSSAILINTARGSLVDIDALYDALDQDRLCGAALDVLPEEPPDPQTPLLGLGDKVLLSPHMITGNRGTGLQMAVPWVTDAIFAALRGELPRHIANDEAIPKWRARFGGKNLL